MSWDYRVVRKRHHGEFVYAIHEVFFDEEDRVWACTTEPVTPMGQSLLELHGELLGHIAAMMNASEDGVVDYDLVPEDGAINIADTAIQDLEDGEGSTIPMDWDKFRQGWMEDTRECRCGNCIHWRIPGEIKGQCSARPLSVTDENFERRNRFAITYRNDWCVRFEDRNE